MATIRNKGMTVTAAGTGINLALGVLYTWSIFKDAIQTSIETGGVGAFTWEITSLNDPYAICCLVFAFGMILAGRFLDAFGPRLTAIIGGVLVGLGFVWISQTTAYISWVLGFGVLVGAGIAFGYSSATPPAMRWFPSTKTGLVAGVVVSGFGLAAVYIAPLAKYLLASWGLQNVMLFFGIAFFVVVSALAMLLENPPESFVPDGFVDRRRQAEENIEKRKSFEDTDTAPGAMMRTPTFWLVWILYFIGAGAGLMVIGSVAGMAKKGLGEAAFWAVAILAIGNAAGRIIAGFVSDRIGRTQTLAFMFGFQALLMFMAIPALETEVPNVLLLLLLTAFIGFNYGANLALFPSITKDLWGFKHFGVNYGLVFTAWGAGGFVMSRASQYFNAAAGNYNSSFMIAGILLILGAGLTFLVKDIKADRRRVLRLEAARA